MTDYPWPGFILTDESIADILAALALPPGPPGDYKNIGEYVVRSFTVNGEKVTP